jgi:hypothetical protein
MYSLQPQLDMVFAHGPVICQCKHRLSASCQASKGLGWVSSALAVGLEAGTVAGLRIAGLRLTLFQAVTWSSVTCEPAKMHTARCGTPRHCLLATIAPL